MIRFTAAAKRKVLVKPSSSIKTTAVTSVPVMAPMTFAK